MTAAHRRVTLAASVLGAAIVALDGTVLAIVQPTLQRDLHATVEQVQWTSTGYLIAVAGLLVLSGRLGDRFGHRRVFAAGMLGFGAASAGIGLATGIGWVIALRVAQGVFGALLQPATLGMLRSAFPPDRLGMPLALRTSAIGVAAAAGPLAGGALAAAHGWRAVFFLNVVPAAASGLAVLAVRDTRTRTTPCDARPVVALDLPGAFLLAGALVCGVLALTDGPWSGGPAPRAAAAAAALVAAWAFVRHERRTANPLVPFDVFGRTEVMSGLAVLVLASGALSATLFAGVYHLQDIRGLNPFESALVALPGPAAMVLAAPAAVMAARRCGVRGTVTVALTLFALGDLVLSRTGTDSSAATGLAFLLVGAGFGAVMVTTTDVVVRHVPEERAGVAGGLQQTAMNVGPALGVAATTALLVSATPPAGAAEGLARVTGPATELALTVLAAVTAAGLLLARGLPGKDASIRTVRVRS